MQHGGKRYEATALYSRGGEQAPRPEQALAHTHLALIQQRAGVRWGCRMCTASTEGHCKIEGSDDRNHPKSGQSQQGLLLAQLQQY